MAIEHKVKGEGRKVGAKADCETKPACRSDASRGWGTKGRVRHSRPPVDLERACRMGRRAIAGVIPTVTEHPRDRRRPKAGAGGAPMPPFRSHRATLLRCGPPFPE